MGEQINPAFWIDVVRTNAYTTDCPAKTRALLNAAEQLTAYFASLRPAADGEAVGEVCEKFACSHSTVVLFNADLPVGTKLYSAPTAATLRVDQVIAELHDAIETGSVSFRSLGKWAAILESLCLGDGGEAGLFALHLMGPDDLQAAPSYETALRVANAVNLQFADHPVKPYAVVVPWNSTPEAHADDLRQWPYGSPGLATHPAPAAREAVPEDVIAVDALAKQLRPYADPNCRECDGSGVWMGNVLVCNCLLDQLPLAAAPPPQAKPQEGEDDPFHTLHVLTCVARLRKLTAAECDEMTGAQIALRERLTPPAAPADEGREVTEEMVERLAKYIYAQEARKCSTLDAFQQHMRNWPRALPEARAMLFAALKGEGR